METFDLESHLQDAYSRFPEAKHQPVIGLTANYEGIDATLRDRYYKQVIAAGGTPVIIPPVADAQVIVNTLKHLDGLILTGGGDHNPLWMGEELLPVFTISIRNVMLPTDDYPIGFQPPDSDAWHLPGHPDPCHCAGRKGVPGYQAAGKAQPGCRPYRTYPHRRNQEKIPPYIIHIIRRRSLSTRSTIRR